MESGKIKTQVVVSTPSQKARYESPRATVRPNKSDTERGMTPAERLAVLTEESRWPTAFGGKYEIAGVVDENGQLNPLGNPMVKGFSRRPRTKQDIEEAVREVQHGKETMVSTRGDRIPDNSIFSHFHPWAPNYGTGLGSKVGISFSGQDLKSAAKRNSKITRARTPNYIFTLRRPKGGWPDGDAMQREWSRVYNDEMQKTRELLRTIGPLTYEEILVRQGRFSATASHRATQAVAKKYGISYTRRRA